MANAATLNKSGPTRILIVGYPGSAKTGSLAALLNSGFKIRMLDYDGNYEPLLKYTDPGKLVNLDILSFEDKMRLGSQGVEPIGTPTAFSDGFKAMDHWTYPNPDGTITDLGHSRDWGPDTVVVLDSLTSMGQAAMNRAMKMQNRTPSEMTDKVWGLAMKEQEAFIEKLTSTKNRHHVIVLAHLKMVGPNDVRKGDNALTQDLKQRVADLVDTRLYPSALGKQLPPVIGGHFPTLLLAEADYKGKAVRHMLKFVPRPELDLKLPAPSLSGDLEVSDGLVKVFDAMGGVANYLDPANNPPPPQQKEEK